jgi:ferrous iron transport protein B
MSRPTSRSRATPGTSRRPSPPAVAELQASLVSNDGKAPLIARAEALLLLTDQDSVRVAGSTPLDRAHRGDPPVVAGRWEAEGMDWAASS